MTAGPGSKSNNLNFKVDFTHGITIRITVSHYFISVGWSDQPLFTKIVSLWLYLPSYRRAKAEKRMYGEKDICPEFLLEWLLLLRNSQLL